MIANKKTNSQWRPSLRAPRSSLYENREWTRGVNSLTAFVVPKWVSCGLLVNGKWANGLKSDFKRRYKLDECILLFQSHHFNEELALRMLTSFKPFNMIIILLLKGVNVSLNGNLCFEKFMFWVLNLIWDCYLLAWPTNKKSNVSHSQMCSLLLTFLRNWTRNLNLFSIYWPKAFLDLSKSCRF